VGTSILITIGSLLAGGAIAAITVVGLVNAQTSPSGASPTNVDQPVTIEYGTGN
jgi:hypothetical protein